MYVSAQFCIMVKYNKVQIHHPIRLANHPEMSPEHICCLGEYCKVYPAILRKGLYIRPCLRCGVGV